MYFIEEIVLITLYVVIHIILIITWDRHHDYLFSENEENNYHG